MLYYGYFSDTRRHPYVVYITTNNSATQSQEITLSDTPCVISQVSDGIFSPIKSRTCTIEIVTEEAIDDLYSPYAHGVEVEVFDIEDEDHPKRIFHGYNTPAAYSQPYAQRVDPLQVEAVDALSTLKNIKYSVANGTSADILRADAIISRLLGLAGCHTDFYYPKSLTTNTNNKILSEIYLNESNFFDDDKENTPWYCYDVLSEIAAYLGWTVICVDDDIFFIDYLDITENDDEDKHPFYHYISSAQTTTFDDPNVLRTITLDDYLGADASISIEENYNKVEVVQNAYNIDEPVTPLTGDNSLSSVTVEAGLGSASYQYTKTSHKKFLWWEWGDDTIYDYNGFSTFFRAKPSTGWTHFYNDVEAESEDDYYNGSTALKPYAAGSTHMTWDVNTNINTKCCLLQKYTGYDLANGAKEPTSLGWTTALTFFNWNDKAGNSMHPRQFTPTPVLKYTSPYKVRYSPAKTGDTSFITFKGDLWYQSYYDNGKKGKKKVVFGLVGTDNKSYCVAPIDGITDLEPYNYKVLGQIISPAMQTRKPTDALYGTGWTFIKASLQIGNKYWNGTSWTNTPSTFTINYNNNPAAGEDEHAMCLEWLKPLSNHTYAAKVGEDCYAIPITKADNIQGNIIFTLYNPLFPLWDFPTDYTTPWYKSFPVIYMKDFSLGFTFANEKPWYFSSIDDSQYDEDIVFTHTIDEDYCTSTYSRELRINSFVDEDGIQSTISRSHALTSNGYVQNVTHAYLGDAGKLQEKNLIDIYLGHYKSPKRIYDATLTNGYDPKSKYAITASEGTYVIDSYTWDLASRKNTIKFIEF